MNRYKNSIPRAVCGVAAVAMMSITIGLSVVVPAKMGSGSQELRALAAAKAVTPASSETLIGSARIDVVAVREPNLVPVQARGVQLKSKQQI